MQGVHAEHPKAFYTKVNTQKPDGGGPPEGGQFQQWLATAEDREMISWQKHSDNGHILEPPEGTVRDWRDPYLFTAGGKTLCCIGGGTETEAQVLIYEASDLTLAKWKYRGVMCSRPRDCYADRKEHPVPSFFFECPNFLEMGPEGKWVLLISPFAPVEYIVGTFDIDTLRFTEETSGVLDPGCGSVENADLEPNFYASNTILEPAEAGGRTLLVGWIRGFPAGGGWNGCLSLPRVLTLSADGVPSQQPIAELQKLRASQVMSISGHPDGHHEGLPLADGEVLAWTCASQQVEVTLTVATGSAKSIKLELAGGGVFIEYKAEERVVEVCGSIAPITRLGELKLQVFWDASVLEVFINDGEATVTRIVYAEPEHRVASVSVEGGDAEVIELMAWDLMPIWAEGQDAAEVAKMEPADKSAARI